MDIFSDNLFEEHDLKNMDIKDFSMNSPIVGDAVRSLYKRYVQNRKDLAALSDQMISIKQDISDTTGSEISSADLISDLLQSNNNFFIELEEIAAKGVKINRYEIRNRFKSMILYLKDKFSISVEFAEEGFIENFSKRYYKDQKLLKISNTLSRESKEFMIAQQIGLLVG